MKNIIIEKAVGYIYYSTDNIIISKFIGLSSVGLLSNYTLIVGTVQTFFVQITNAVQASLGNLVHSENDKEKINDIFNKFSFLCFLTASFSVVSFMILTKPFIQLWLGKHYVMPENIILLLSITYYTSTMRMPLGQMTSAYGMFRQTKNISILGAVVNLTLSLILVNYVGVAGTLTGTMVCDLVYWAGHTYYVIGKKLSLSCMKYILKMLQYAVITLAECVVAMLIGNLVTGLNDFTAFIIKGVICIILPNSVNLFIFRKSNEMGYFIELLKVIYGKMMEMVVKRRTN